MKTLSVFVSFALLVGANRLAAHMRQAGSLPSSRSAAAAAASATHNNGGTTYVKAISNVSTKSHPPE